MQHPRSVLVNAAGGVSLPVCDHYCGTEARILKSLALQADLMAQWGACVMDVTMDCDDGAPAGAERDHALMVCDLARQVFSRDRKAHAAGGVLPRIATRVHAVGHPAFAQDIQTVVGGAADVLCHVMIPQVQTLADVEAAVQAVDQACAQSSRPTTWQPLPLHVLVESPTAVQHVFAIAAHPRVQSISFGLMDFVSAHGGAIPACAMSVSTPAHPTDLDQFHHPLVVQAKLAIASACHAWHKAPSHGVVTEYGDADALFSAASLACRAFGFTRMWSIHPDQVRPILAAFAPPEAEIAQASHIIRVAASADWAPVAVAGRLHDRASFRYFWQVLERAFQTGRLPPDDPACRFFVA